MIDLKSILGQNAFFQTNKKIASVVGHDAAAFMTYLIEKDGYFSNDQVYKNGKNYFFLLSDDIEKDVYISYKVQKRCIADLEKLGFIETRLMGIPRRLYFTINDSIVLNFMTTINDQNDKAINAQRSTMLNTKSEISYKELNIENLNKEYIDTSKNENLPLEAKKEIKEIKNKEIPTLQNPFTKWTLEEFKNSIIEANKTNIPKSQLEEFYDYWREPDIKGKMKFQKQPTWETSLRLKTWVKNSLKFNKEQTPQSQGQTSLKSKAI